MTFDDRYASAVRSSNLRGKSDAEGAVDVLGAAGLAGRQAPLAIALQRLIMAGDDRTAEEVVRIMAGMLVGKAWHSEKVALPRPEATDMSKAVLGWYRKGTCKKCRGHGLQLIRGAPTLSSSNCPDCRGTGKLLFDRHFSMERLWLARWLLAEMERELAKAGPLAMAALAPRFSFD